MQQVPAPLMVNAFDPDSVEGLDARMQSLVTRRRKSLGPSYKLFYETPVHVVRAEGVWLYGPNEEAYLDVYNNVPSVGHCHPRVVAAIAKQAATLNVHTRYLNEVVLDYAERLLGTFPGEMSNAMFTCTGGEASDLALRIAQYATGNTGVIVTQNAYHGLTAAVSAVSPSLGDGVPLGAHVRTVPAPSESAAAAAGKPLGEWFAENVRSAIADLERHGIRASALIVDTIFSSDGIFSDPAGFLAPAVAVIREAGGLFIADEVQPGFGRTGDAMWGFMRHGVVPDVAVLGKPMGNGIPIAGIVAKPEVLHDFGKKARYFNTFGGNPVSCAAGMAVLDVIETEGLVDNAKDVGNYLMAGLRDLAKRQPELGQVRGAGLFIGVDLVDPATGSLSSDIALKLVNGLRDRRILISASGRTGTALKIRPPLSFSKENADHFLSALGETLADA